MAYTNYDEAIVIRPLLESAGLNDVEVNSSFIYFAEKEVDGWFAGVFTVPFSPVPPQIKDITINLTYANALWYKDAESAIALKDEILARVKRIKEGDELLTTDSGQLLARNPGQEIWSSNEDYHTTFSMLDAEDALTMVDSGRLLAEENERN
jgi:hypothetical protein